LFYENTLKRAVFASEKSVLDGGAGNEDDTFILGNSCRPQGLPVRALGWSVVPALKRRGTIMSVWCWGKEKRKNMATVTKKELVDRIAEQLQVKRVIVKRVTQQFLDEVIAELGVGNRLEFRDFGVFECRQKAARVAQNPKTMERVPVPSKRTVKFKVGRLMKQRLQEIAKEKSAREAHAKA
jgi:integration host factor subunit beta